MSTFNRRRLNTQELLAKEDIELLLTALNHWSINVENSDRIEFLKQKLERMKK